MLTENSSATVIQFPPKLSKKEFVKAKACWLKDCQEDHQLRDGHKTICTWFFLEYFNGDHLNWRA